MDKPQTIQNIEKLEKLIHENNENIKNMQGEIKKLMDIIVKFQKPESGSPIKAQLSK